MKTKALLVALLALALPASADLVGLYTFDGANPLEAVIGVPAYEGVIPANNKPPSLSDTLQTISFVTDPDVLGTRSSVIAVPVKSTLAIPNPGLLKDWTIVLPFYCPDNANYRCFLSLSPSNGGDGSLFIKNNAQIGASSYDNTAGIVGAWHQLVISSENNSQTVWYDSQKLVNTRSWTLPGTGLLYFSLDNDGEDAMMYLDDIRLYDETAPAEVFPNGRDAGPAILDPWTEAPYADDVMSFSRTPDDILDEPGYRTYVFRRHGAFTFASLRNRPGTSALFVGGGGAGGMIRGGGGGGGAVVYVDNFILSTQTYTATVGRGGIPQIHSNWHLNGQQTSQLHPGPSPATTCGGATTLADFSGTVLYSAPGGGGGGNFNYANGNLPAESYGLDGASGGGASGMSTQPGHGTLGLGNDGGEASTDGDNAAGGGGGAGGPGTKGSNSAHGAGGAGIVCSITGEEVLYGGGGGGSSYNLNGGLAGEGGGGAGVSSKSDNARSTACSGVDGLGGGGGGGSGRENNPRRTMGGRGGNGTVILRVSTVNEDDPSPLISLSASEVGYTNATLSATLVSLGDDGSSADVSLVISPNQDLSQPVFSGTIGSGVADVPSVISVPSGTLALDTLYYAQATAVNNLGTSGSSALVSFRTLVPGPVFSARVGTDHIAPDVSLSFTDGGWGGTITQITVQVSASGSFDNPDWSKTFLVDLSEMPTNVNDIVLSGLPAESPLYYRFTAVNSYGFSATVDKSAESTLNGNNVWSGLSEDVDDPAAYVFAGGLPAPGKTLYFTSPAGLSPVIDADTDMPSLRFTDGQGDSANTGYLNGHHSCGYDLSGSGVLTFTAEKPIWHATKGTNVIENPILFSRSNSQTVYVVGRNGRLDLTGELMLPDNVSNTTMRVNGEGGEVHFGGPSPDFMGQLTLESSFTLSLDSPNAMTNVSRIHFEGGWGSFTYLKNNSGVPMTFPRCAKISNTTGWSSTRTCYAGGPMIFPVATLVWCPRAYDSSTIGADLVVKDLQVAKHDSNGDAVLDKLGTGMLAVMETTSWDTKDCKHYIRLRNGCFWPKTAAGQPPSGEYYAPDGANNNMGTLGLSDDYYPMLDGSATPRVFQENAQTRWGFTGFGGDRTVCWNRDSSLNLTNTTSDNVSIKLSDTTTVNSVGKTYNNYYAYPARFMFGNRSEFADGTVLFLNPIRYELGQNWDTATYFESTNHVVAARMRGSLKLGNRDRTWNFSGRNFGGYLALEAENTDFTGRVNVQEKGSLLVNDTLAARSATVQSGAGLGGTGTLETTDGTTVKSGGALFGGEWNKGGTLTLGGKLTFENGSALRVEVGASNDRIGCVKLASGSTLKLGSPVYVDVDTDPRISPVRGVAIKVLDWSEASFASGAAPTAADFVERPESNPDIRGMYLFVRDNALYVNYISVRYPASTILILR